MVVRPKPYAKNKLVSWNVIDEATISHDEIGDFKYDHVFSTCSDNAEVYQKTSVPLIDKLIEGYNATIFAYGMTGSGKTFTMSGTEEEQGIIPLSISYLFNRLMEEGERNKEYEKYEVALSYLEIYNEKINDLLDNENTHNNSSMPSTPSRFFTTSHYSNGTKDLKIRDDSQYGVRVVGLSEKRCKDSGEVLEWIHRGDKFRKTGETEYNTRSSRSHAIVLLRLTSIDIRTGGQSTRTLSLCDLAGSERGLGQNERRKEGAFINKSLLALGTVISRLSAENSNMNSNNNILMSPGASSSSSTGHIPYRDSKLTRLLQPALSGNSLITALCTIDLRTESNNETLNTLRFANRAKNVSLNVRNVSNNNGSGTTRLETQVHDLRIRLQEQEQELKRLRQVNSTSSENSNSSTPVALVTKENELLRNKLHHYESMLLNRSSRDTSSSSSSQSQSIAQYDSELTEIASLLPPEIGAVLHAKFDALASQLRQQQQYTEKLEQNLNEQVAQLTRSLQTKDKLIEALTSAKRLEN